MQCTSLSLANLAVVDHPFSPFVDLSSAKNAFGPWAMG